MVKWFFLKRSISGKAKNGFKSITFREENRGCAAVPYILSALPPIL
jgi:hypothetical protein